MNFPKPIRIKLTLFQTKQLEELFAYAEFGYFADKQGIIT